jgi:hypothetical protein
MDVVEITVGYLTGLHLLAPHHLEFPALLATGLLVNACNAVMCRVIARNNGYSPRLWTGVGMVFGIWAVAFLLLAPTRASESR